MAKLTRRGFFRQTSASMATLGVLAAVPALSAATDAPEVTEAAQADLAELSPALLSEPVVAHVRDLATGEVSLLVGTQEIIYRDPDLVMRLLRVMH